MKRSKEKTDPAMIFSVAEGMTIRVLQQYNNGPVFFEILDLDGKVQVEHDIEANKFVKLLTAYFLEKG